MGNSILKHQETRKKSLLWKLGKEREGETGEGEREKERRRERERDDKPLASEEKVFARQGLLSHTLGEQQDGGLDYLVSAWAGERHAEDLRHW